MAFPALKTVPRKVGVVVATHNRAHFLPIALQSILNQTHKPERIIVVDDNSTDGTREVCKRFPVEYHHIVAGSGLQSCHAKRYGFELLEDLPYACCVDDDDHIDANYLEKLLETIESDCRLAAACPRVQQFGDRTEVIDCPCDPDTLSRTNVASSTSLLRMDALLQVGGWPVVGSTEHEDWALWRRLRSHGWRIQRQNETTYHWRRHSQSQTYRLRGANGEGELRKPDHNIEWARTLDRTDLVTIAIPFCGRSRTLHQQLDWLERQTFPHGFAHLLFFDNSLDMDFGRRLRQWLATCDYAGQHYFPYHLAAQPHHANHQTADHDRLEHATAVNHRCAGNWNRIAQLVQTDLVLCLEDDVIPPANCLDRMLRAFRPDVAAVAAPYFGRNNSWVAKDFTSLSPIRINEKHLPGGVETCDAPGLGCVLVRRQALQSVPMRSNGEDPDGHRWFDWNFWADVKRQGLGVVKIDGDLVCDHLMYKPKVRRRPDVDKWFEELGKELVNSRKKNSTDGGHNGE